jgi:hypothetical protein
MVGIAFYWQFGRRLMACSRAIWNVSYTTPTTSNTSRQITAGTNSVYNGPEYRIAFRAKCKSILVSAA